ncbi:nuclear transport factor 2 family protein [Nocardia sp. R6R-6]|uniref:nuclear transport factor 2 family protein n=1 Tax=Nocardia sp. R6R-6 TaxID=3459303 RepID=UPI00403D9787
MTKVASKNESPFVGKVESVLAAMSEGNLERVGELFAEDIVYQLTGQHQFSGKYEGRQSILGLLAGVNSNFPDGVSYTADRIIAVDDTVIATFTGIGTTASGKKYHNEYCAIWDFNEDQQVSHIREYFDSHHVLSVMGPEA